MLQIIEQKHTVCFQGESFDPLLRKFELFCPYFRGESNLTEIRVTVNKRENSFYGLK